LPVLGQNGGGVQEGEERIITLGVDDPRWRVKSTTRCTYNGQPALRHEVEAGGERLVIYTRLGKLEKEAIQ
jgi:hypothetical protein